MITRPTRQLLKPAEAKAIPNNCRDHALTNQHKTYGHLLFMAMKHIYWVIRERTVLLQLPICCYAAKADLLHLVEKEHEYSYFRNTLQICINVIAQAALL